MTGSFLFDSAVAAKCARSLREMSLLLCQSQNQKFRLFFGDYSNLR